MKITAWEAARPTYAAAPLCRINEIEHITRSRTQRCGKNRERREMKSKMILALFVLASICLPSVSAHWEEHDLNGQYLFGYAGVGENPQLYMPEVERNLIPTNVASLTINNPTDKPSARINYLNSRGQRAVLVLDSLLFIQDPNLPTPCGADSWRIRLDYQTRFDNWVTLNAANLTASKVAMLVINTEVNNRCIPSYSLDQVTQFVKARVTSIPTVAGYGRSGPGAQLLPETIPSSLAGVLFFKYQVLDPRTDDSYQSEFTLLKSKLTSEQRIILVPDGFYSSSHAAAGWPKWYLGYLAMNYAELAKGDPRVVGLIFFLWPGFGDPSDFNLGSRELPQSIRDRQRLAACGLLIQSPLSSSCQ
jgi:hypothetical protein